MRHRTTLIAVTIAALAIPTAALAAPGLDEAAAATVASARATAGSAAAGLLQAQGEGRGLDPDRARGLERAREVSSSWRFTGEDKPGKGPKGASERGNARSQQVHAALAAGLSPSAIHNPGIDKPGKELQDAFNGFKAKRDDHPGRGQGKGLGGPGGPDDDSSGDD